MIKKIIIFGCSKTEFDLKMKGFAQEFSNLTFKIVEVFPEIQVEIIVHGEIQEKAEQLIKPCLYWFHEEFSDCVVSFEGHSLETVLGKILNEKNATVAIAESCTGGLISHKLTNVPGSSNYFVFSCVAYSNHSKINVLGVSPRTIEKYGAVHTQTAIEMAVGVRRISGADIGLSTTGIAGPGGGTQMKPLGTVCLGFASSKKSEGFQLNFSIQDRSLNKEIFTASALDLLRRHLLQ